MAYPNSLMDSLASSKVNIALKKGLNPYYPIPFSNNFLGTTTNYNNYSTDNDAFAKISKDTGFALVDLFSLFKKIAQNNYVTDDGIRVENKMNGNFFSSDGISLTAFGQSVIANEFIKAINKQYSMDIPLIKTSEYLTK